MSDTFSFLTYNIHKGFNTFNRNLSVHKIKDKLIELNPDLIFLQEVIGRNLNHELKQENWPKLSQAQYLASNYWNSVYGKNVNHKNGHHGNAILTKYPVESHYNQNVTHLSFEKRGILHTKIMIGEQRLHCVCVHLSLFSKSRLWQINELINEILKNIPKEDPIIIAGDFNDWSKKVCNKIIPKLELKEAFIDLYGKYARTFPSNKPILSLDRVYVRGLEIKEAEVLSGKEWFQISDHSPLKCTFELKINQPPSIILSK